MLASFEGESELDRGPLGALSEAYLTTNPCGMFIIVHFMGTLDLPVWGQALTKLQQSYPILNSVLQEEKRRGVYRLVRKPVENLVGLKIKEVFTGDTQGFIRNYLMQAFDLFREPPIRFILLKQPSGRHSLVFNAHHSAADGVTVLSILRDLFVCYHQLKAGNTDYTGSLFNNRRSHSAVKRPALLPNLKNICTELIERKRRPLIWRRREMKSLRTQATVRSFILDADQTQRLILRAKGSGLSVNDLLNVAIIQTIDAVRPVANGLLSACIPVNLRPFVGGVGRYANLTSGIYVNLSPQQRQSEAQVTEVFTAKRKALLKQGRPVVNLQLLQKIFRILRLFPQEYRQRWLEKRGSYPASYLCSNLGQAFVTETQNLDSSDSSESFAQVEGLLKIRDWEVMISPNRNVDYSVFALTLSHRLKIFISTDDTVLGSVEPDDFYQQLRGRLVS